MVEKDILNFIDTANLKSGLLKKKKEKYNSTYPLSNFTCFQVSAYISRFTIML